MDTNYDLNYLKQAWQNNPESKYLMILGATVNLSCLDDRNTTMKMNTLQVNKCDQAKSLSNVLLQQIHEKRLEKDLEIVNKFKEEVRENSKLTSANQQFKQMEDSQKLNHRNQLKMEIARVLEQKRIQKLNRQAEEFKYYL